MLEISGRLKPSDSLFLNSLEHMSKGKVSNSQNIGKLKLSSPLADHATWGNPAWLMHKVPWPIAVGRQHSAGDTRLKPRQRSHGAGCCSFTIMIPSGNMGEVRT